MSFRSDFIWGASTSSYQIEGARKEDGKGLSVWDAFTRMPGRIFENHTGDVACDHYHRYVEDIKLWKSLGLKAYRFSMSWPRILPDGVGRLNEKGVDFYKRLVDELLDNGITPFATLFHWDYPYELFCRGGWLNPDSSNWFAHYAQRVAEALGDRVVHWMTLNEPQVIVTAGHQEGRHAPGLKLPRRELALITHNVLLAHGKSVSAIRDQANSHVQIGFAPVANIMFPVTDSPEDIMAAREATFSPFSRLFNSNICWMDPVFLGKYDERQLSELGADAPKILTEDEKTIATPLDFIGVNLYQGGSVRMGKDGKPEKVSATDNLDLTACRWAVTPEIMYWGARFIAERYQKPIYVTENGMSGVDWVSQNDGQVHDPQRIEFLTRYLRSLRRATEFADLRGYFQWSIMDNFEWEQGYKERFGLIYVDYNTQKRVPKDSAYWYKDIIASNGECLA